MVFKKNDQGETLWLITASKPSKIYPKSVWRLPKGWIDNNGPDIPGPMASGEIKADEDSLQKSALREVKEEGGIEAKIIKKIASEKYFYKHPIRGPILKFVTFYLMEWIKNTPEGFDDETEEVAWLPFLEAKNKLNSSGEKTILTKAALLV